MESCCRPAAPSECQIIESTAEKELLKKQWHTGSRFFLASEGEEWILLEKPVSSKTLQQMQTSFWLTRAVFLRGLGLLCCSVFSGAFNQNVGLIGETGILPAMRVYDAVWREEGITWTSAIQKLGLFAIIPPCNAAIRSAAVCSVASSLILVILGACNAFIMALLWTIHASFSCVGQHWYFTEDRNYSGATGAACDRIFSQLLLWSTFLLPLVSLHQRPQGTPPPQFSLLSSRWFLFHLAWKAFYAIVNITWTTTLPFFTVSLHPYTQYHQASFIDWYLQVLPSQVRQLFCAAAVTTDLLATGIILLSPSVRLRRVSASLHLLVQLGFFLLSNQPMLTSMSLLLGIFAFDDLCFRWFFSETTLRRLPLQYRSETICSPWLSLKRLLSTCSWSKRGRGAPRRADRPSAPSDGAPGGTIPPISRVFRPPRTPTTAASPPLDDPHAELLQLDQLLGVLPAYCSTESSPSQLCNNNNNNNTASPSFQRSTVLTREPYSLADPPHHHHSSDGLHQRQTRERGAKHPLPAPRRSESFPTSTGDLPATTLTTHHSATDHPHRLFAQRRASPPYSLFNTRQQLWPTPSRYPPGVIISAFFGCWSTLFVALCTIMHRNTPCFFSNLLVSVAFGFGVAIVSATLVQPPLLLTPTFHTRGTAPAAETFSFAAGVSARSAWIPIVWGLGYGVLSACIKVLIDTHYPFLLSFVALVVALLVLVPFCVSVIRRRRRQRRRRRTQGNDEHSSEALLPTPTAPFGETGCSPYTTWAHLTGLHGLRELFVGYLLFSSTFLYFVPTATVPALSKGRLGVPQRPHALPGTRPFTSRIEILVEGSSLDPSDYNTTTSVFWVPLKLKCGIDSSTRAPCIPLPYLYRLDYAMELLAQTITPQDSYRSWLPNFLCVLLQNELSVISLLRRMRFRTRESSPLKLVRARQYLYHFTPWKGNVTAFQGPWWTREYLGELISPMALDNATPQRCTFVPFIH